MTEAQYQAKLIKRLEDMFPGCLITKGDSLRHQGILDLIILWGERWASLEVKAFASADRQPNQEHYVRRLNDMSFAAFIYPENEEEVLSALEQAFEPPRRARISKS